MSNIPPVPVAPGRDPNQPINPPTDGCLDDFDDVELLASGDLRLKDPTRNNAPTSIVITLASPIHPDRKRMEMAHQRRLLATIRKSGQIQVDDPEERELAEIDKLVSCTLGWRGARTPFSPAAARALYSDPKRMHIRWQVRDALDDMELFTRRSARN